MQVGDKLYTFYNERIGELPLSMIIVEGEVLSVEEKELTNIQGEPINKTIVEIKTSYAGSKHLFDGIAEKTEDDGETYEWTTVYQQSQFFNYWYKDKNDCIKSIEFHLNELQNKLNERFAELKELQETGTTES